jgi:two-component system nitrogen regulation sensor histidine kinase NtrY
MTVAQLHHDAPQSVPAAADKTATQGEANLIPARSSTLQYARRFGIPFVVVALIFGAVSFLILLRLTPVEPTTPVVYSILGINTVFTVVMLALVGREVRALLRARRKRRAVARMHIRIVGLFGIVSAFPAILVALIAGISLDQGLERIFDDRSRVIVENSISIARSYVGEATDNLNSDTVSTGIFLNRNRSLFNLDRTGFQDLLRGQARARGLAAAYVVQSNGARLAGGKAEDAGPLPDAPPELLSDAAGGRPACIIPNDLNIAACAFLLSAFPQGTFLYTINYVDPRVLNSVTLMQELRDEYQALEGGRIAMQLAFALLYAGLCVTILLAAIWMGIAVADRLVEPIRRLIVAADDVASGNLAVSVPATRSEGELRSLTTTFNSMVAELQTQRNEILETQELIDQRRRFTEAVLSGVSAGVLGVNNEGMVTIANSSAEAIFGEDLLDKSLPDAAPELAQLVDRADSSGRRDLREQITAIRDGRERTFNVQVTVSQEGEGTHSHVVTIDDITDLVSAQRTSAWADVARRIAHEIKNPLTPIQLSAERIRRRYGKVITEDREVFDQCTETIIRQVADIGRMVDEFSSFARMPKPKIENGDLASPLREAVFLLRVGNPEIAFETEFGPQPLPALFDQRLLGQVFGNLIKNAVEGIEGVDYGESESPFIRIQASVGEDFHTVEIIDNGKGLPAENRARLLEPYMTTREKGTGLGLAIVSKVLEEHGGWIELSDAPQVADGGHGALVRVKLPALPVEVEQLTEKTEENDREIKDGI